MKVHIKWANGDEDVETSCCATLDNYAQSRWGLDTAAEVLEKYGHALTEVAEEAADTTNVPPEGTEGTEGTGEAPPPEGETNAS